MPDFQFEVSQKLTINPPRSDEAYIISCREWALLKEQITALSTSKYKYDEASWAFFGASLSTFVGLFVGDFPSGIPLVVNLSILIFTLVIGLLCLNFSKIITKSSCEKAAEILSQMELIETRFESEQLDFSISEEDLPF